MLARAISCGLDGVNGFLVDVEAFLTNGLFSFDVVGLPSAAVKESRDRVRAAVTVSGEKVPFRKITVNLSPADVKKEGTGYDLAIAVVLLAAESPKYKGLNNTLLLGELSLEGKLIPIRGALPMVISAFEQGIRQVILPQGNAKEIQCVAGMTVYPAETLAQVLAHLEGKQSLPSQKQLDYHELHFETSFSDDMRYVRGQSLARKALEVAAAGGHNMLMIGVPGSGKTMLARCLPGILPPLGYEEALETTKIYSAAGVLSPGSRLLTVRPFRAPHHSASLISIIGGGANAHPGEASLAHNGVLFLDELPEYQRGTLEALRQPLEDGFVNITRAGRSAHYQSRFMLLASMNPCPCGNHGSQSKECRCTETEISRYLHRISGPMLDRMDIRVEMDAVPVSEIETLHQPEPSEDVRRRVTNARALQKERYQSDGFFCNAQLTQAGVTRYCVLPTQGKALLTQAAERFHISMRAYARIQKLARTLSDLEGREQISTGDVAQAIQFRNIGGQYWRES